ncbi:DUF1846 family protein [Candidatus Dojkabacteria bacterium]|nr:DUF1846 family protein [Candidatus Dojkabacteria bacterium]
MNSADTIDYKVLGFDSQKYFKLQKQEVLKRLDKFAGGRLYLEIGGKFLYDPHAARVLPGFDPYVKKRIFADLASISEILFCVNYDDILSDRQLKNTEESYKAVVEKMLSEIVAELDIKPKLVVNKIRNEAARAVSSFVEFFSDLGYEIFKRYYIADYPDDVRKILSDKGFGRDEYVEIDRQKNLVLVTGAASNSGKMSTCLGQMYHDSERNIESGYAKFELFPIWNLPIHHPVNLAYEAATVDIGDYNVKDSYHLKEHGREAVSYNRDLEAFKLLRKIANEFTSDSNFIRTYKSPTDMGISMAGSAITDDEVVRRAAIEEIKRRKIWYQEIVNRGDGKLNWVNRCEELLAIAQK